ncbi:response regulator [Paenibacillus sp. JNUCC31]|uniref:ATP-binding protein n=1 Tax=Paenibacillus sp. JNUCC-31 TaxID=2777983 RepID=UPI00177C3329|nr:ATP-binding protein [Paenibacillus sp. JNUCC-31]QOS78766.1 response regulator [Paenibacillus sp. JNUCC-31]
MKSARAVFMLLLTCLCLTSFGVQSLHATAIYKAKQGTMDLTRWDSERDGIIRLDGEWGFDWGTFREPAHSRTESGDDAATACLDCKSGYFSVPGLWNSDTELRPMISPEGYATYRLFIRTSEVNGLYGLYIKSIHSSYRLYVNGELISTVGMPGTSPGTTVGRYGKPLVLFHHEGALLEVMLQVANYDFPTGGIDKSILFGSEEQMVAFWQQGLARNLFLFGSILTIAIYHLVLYVLRRNNRSTLYFSLFCFMMAIRTVFVNERFILVLYPEMNYELFVKVSYLTAYLGLPLLIQYIYGLYPAYFSVRTVRFVNGISLLMSGIILVTNVKIYHNTLPYFQAFILLVLMYILARLGLAAFRREQGTVLLLIAFVNLFIFSANDILYNHNLNQLGTLVPFGMFIFILLQSFLLSVNFSKAFTRIKQLSDRLMVLDRSKDQFLHNTSHELKTPLQGIIGLTESLAEGSAGPLPPAAIRQLRLIQSSGQRLSHLVHDLLDFTRLKDKEIVLQPSVLNIRDTGDIVIRLLRPLAEGKPIQFHNDISPQYQVYADENRLLQMFSNLIGNAVKFTESGSITLDAGLKGNEICITVRDTGIGLPDDWKQSIFEAFEQGDGSITRKYGGTGIGLSITKHLVELHGGRIWVESAEGQGSMFSFTLPVHGQSDTSRPKLSGSKHNAERREPSTIEQSKPYLGAAQDSGIVETTLAMQFSDSEEDHSKGARILVVDDEPVILQILHNHLSLAGHQVVQAGNGQKALDLLAQGCDPDLVITDLMMPHMSGYELCRMIRQHVDGHLPILILTARNQPSDIELGFDAGATDYLIKPVTRTELMSRVSLHLKLASWNDTIEQEVIKRTVHIRQTMRETAIAMADISVVEERNRITKEIHDAMGYSLTTTLMQLEAGKSLIPDKPDEALRHMTNSQELVRRGLSDIRRSLKQLKEEEQEPSFGERINRLIRDTETYTEVKIQEEILLDQALLNAEQQEVFYFALQEGLTNGIRHGNSKQFQLHLSERDDHMMFRLSNVGKPYSPKYPGIGLHYMQKAVNALGGSIIIDDHRGRGCQITILLRKKED